MFSILWQYSSVQSREAYPWSGALQGAPPRQALGLVENIRLARKGANAPAYFVSPSVMKFFFSSISMLDIIFFIDAHAE